MAIHAASHSRDLTDEEWVLIGPFLPKLARRTDGRGRPWRENRAALNGIMWILRTGAPWADLPDRYPSYRTCHRLSTTKAIWICMNLHRWELRTSEARSAGVAG